MWLYYDDVVSLTSDGLLPIKQIVELKPLRYTKFKITNDMDGTIALSVFGSLKKDCFFREVLRPTLVRKNWGKMTNCMKTVVYIGLQGRDWLRAHLRRKPESFSLQTNSFWRQIKGSRDSIKVASSVAR